MTSYQEQLKAAASSGDTTHLQHLLETTEPPSPETVQSLFQAAASASQVSTLECLLTHFPSVPLHEDTVRAAVYTGSIPLFAALLARDPSVARMPFEKRGYPLIIACNVKHPMSYLRFLLDAGADPNQDPDAASFPLALAVAFYADVDVVDLLLEYGARAEHSGALSAAAWRGNESMVQHLLRRGAKSDKDAPVVGRGETPVHVAARKGHVGVLKILIESGADVGLTDYRGMTPLTAAEEVQGKGDDRVEVMDLLKGVVESSCK